MLGFKREKKQRPEEEGGDLTTSSGDVIPGAAGHVSSSLAGRSPAKRLGEILIEQGLIGLPQLEEALAKQQAEGGFIGEILVRLGFVKQDDIVSCLVKQCKIPHLNLLDYEVTKEVLQIIPKELCLKHNLLPIDKLGRILTIAMVNPFDVEALEEVRKLSPDLRIKPILCDWEHFRVVVGRVFGEADSGSKQANDDKSFGLRPPRSAAAVPASAPKPALKPDLKSAAETKAAMEAAVSSLLNEAEDLPEAESPSAPPSDARPVHDRTAAEQHISTVVRESVGGAIQEAMATLMVESRAEGTRRNAGTSASSDQGAGVARQETSETAVSASGTQEIAEAIRQSVGSAMQEALAQVVVQMRASMPRAAGANHTETPDLDEIVRSTVRETLRESEEAAVARMNRRDLEARDAERLKREKHSSVSSFDTVQRRAPAASGNPEARLEADDRVLAAMRSDRLLAGFTFDGFCVGKSNAFTFKLCEAVSQTPGEQYNPFFVYGDVGLGKTHLINAVGNAILSRDPEQRVGYVSSSRFTSRLADATRDEAVDAFRANYCHWDVLILDDIQFLGGRLEAQEEFFHIFNVLQQEGRQIIIAGDKPPDRLGLLEQRLVSRFAGGIVVNLKPPEWETRMSILERHAKRAGVDVNEEIASLISMRVPNDVRKMIGALRKVIAYAELVNEPISSEMANDILAHLGIEEAA